MQCFDNNLFPSKVSGNRKAPVGMSVVASKNDDAASNSVANETADASASAKVATTARAHTFGLTYLIYARAQPIVHVYNRTYMLG